MSRAPDAPKVPGAGKMWRTHWRPHGSHVAAAVSAAALLLVLGGVPLAVASVPSAGCTMCSAVPTPMPSVPNAINAYEIAPGVETVDPAVADDPASEEVILNVYQTLVTYNGDDTGSFVPELATCVPGTAQCEQLFGSSLIVNGTGGSPQYFTFPIDPAAHFYDPKTGVGWPVYPSDVLFSFARLESFANLPYAGSAPGGIASQALLPAGNISWDDGIHYPYNNTPQNVLSTILVNDSALCPAAALAANGCVTFDASGSGTSWPGLLSILAGPTGAGIEPCGWFSFIGAGVPGFNGTAAPYGDGPCLLPGGGNATDSSGFQAFLANTPPSDWDELQLLSENDPLAPQPAVQWTAVGSGPYDLEGIDPDTGYVLGASPAYRAPTGCAGAGACEPLSGTYYPRVNVFYEPNDTVGVQEYMAGRAAMGALGPTDSASFNALQAAGKIGNLSVPTLRTNFQTYNLDFNVANENRIDPTGQLNVPADYFSYNGLREFLSLAYPYATIAPTLQTSYGVPSGFDYGGAIPQYLGSEYPTNISWPSTDPSSNAKVVGTAGWYWTQTTLSTSPLYDPELSHCTAANPCRFPIMFPTIDGTVDVGPLSLAQLDDWTSSIVGLSAGALEPYLLGSYCPQYASGPVACDVAPGESPYTTIGEGSAAAYADPNAVVGPIYGPDSSWPYYDSLRPQFDRPQFDSPSCGYESGSWQDLLYWANAPFVATDCQGVAYDAMVAWIGTANLLAPGAYRTLVYNEVEHVANLLALYVYAYQSSNPETYASWVNPTSLNTNPVIGGEGIETWYSLRAVGPAPPTQYPVMFHESGLPVNSNWSASVNGSTIGSDSLSLVFDLPNGSYAFALEGIGGYSASPGSGTIEVNGSAQAVFVAYVPAPGTYTIRFVEMGLPQGTAWSVALNGSLPVRGSLSSISFSLPNGTYSYSFGRVDGYTGSSTAGSFWVIGGGENISLQYVAIIPTYSLRFAETGLPGGTPWSVTLGSANSTVTTSSSAWEMPNGTYAYTIASVGYRATPPSGSIAIAGKNATLNVTFATEPSANGGGTATAGLPTWAWAGVASAAVVGALAIGWIALRPARTKGPRP